MDTNQNNGQNYQINAFVKGMNSDTSLDQVSNEQYLFGRNIRITNNALLTQDINSNNKEGIVTPVPVGQSKDLGISGSLKTILATASIGNIGAIILKKQDDTWDVYKVQLNNDEITPTLLFSSKKATDKKQFSVVINKEQENLIKLYIADGENGIMQLFLQHPTITDLSKYYKDKEIDDLISHKYFPTNKVIITGVIGGQLKTSQVQYTYRLYQKYGTFSKLAPLTNKIQIINNNRNTEEGNAEDTKTSMGLSLLITGNKLIFDHIQVYRIQYVKAGQTPEINLIKDQKLQVQKNEEGEPVLYSIKIDDTGLDSLQQLSLDEFSALDGQDIIPTVIESNQGYLFGANIKDTTVFDLNVDVSGININLVKTKVPFSDTSYSLDFVPDLNDADNGFKYVKTDNDVDPKYRYVDYLKECGINTTNSFKPEKNYNDMFTSSLLRSLRRGETYRYGIIFYNKYGQKTHTRWVKDVVVDELTDTKVQLFDRDDYLYWANSLGVEVVIPETLVNELVKNDVVGYEIVRCQKTNEYSKTLVQCALARPVQQYEIDNNERMTPYYPMPFISSDFLNISWLGVDVEPQQEKQCFGAFNINNHSLFQAFSSSFLVNRTTQLQQLSETTKLHPLYRAVSVSNSLQNEYSEFVQDQVTSFEIHYLWQQRGILKVSPRGINYKKEKKSEYNNVCFFFDIGQRENPKKQIDIKTVKDVKNPTFEQGFTNIQQNGTNSSISEGVKSYKSYSTIIDTKTYTNWIAQGKYDLAIYENEALSYPDGAYLYGGTDGYKQSLHDYRMREFTDSHLPYEKKGLKGWIGPGPVCFLLDTEDITDNSLLNSYFNNPIQIGTVITNITHSFKNFSDDKQYDIYYGFGNYRNIEKDKDNKCIIFDGDIYDVPCEFTSMFKAWDFRSINDYIESTQVVNYIPMETKVNTFFDYGMNYRNTQNANLQLEPGTIPGIATQDRPLHQYNLIYSDNDTSVSVYYAQPLEKTQNVYPHRIVYSQQKTNGENIDNWNIFKPIDFVDADTRYGEITELMTVNDILYFWQNTAFGKLSVNERSLVVDENSNTIQLGQGGVLQRTDYISTKYGMRPEDYSAIEAEGGVYWIDILNKAIVAYLQGRVINYGEYVNVQNIINNLISEDIPQIDYDLQNMELLCKCFYNKEQESYEQLVFSTKLGCATSLYNRSYNNIISFNNVLYGLEIYEESQLKVRKLNYLTNNQFNELLQPEELSFVVNSSPSQTKVFDNQKIVTLKRDYELDDIIIDRMANKTLSFETDLNQKSHGLKEDEIKKAGVYTDREGNICYTIPRQDNIDKTTSMSMPLRLRGKWMKVDIKDKIPQQDFAISHVITKFRQSYS